MTLEAAHPVAPGVWLLLGTWAACPPDDPAAWQNREPIWGYGLLTSDGGGVLVWRWVNDPVPAWRPLTWIMLVRPDGRGVWGYVSDAIEVVPDQTRRR